MSIQLYGPHELQMYYYFKKTKNKVTYLYVGKVLPNILIEIIENRKKHQKLYHRYR
jgi:hypothetical protein